MFLRSTGFFLTIYFLKSSTRKHPLPFDDPAYYLSQKAQYPHQYLVSRRASLMLARYYTEGFLISHLCFVLSLAKEHSLCVVFFHGLSQASCILPKTDAISAILPLKALISSPMLFSLISYAQAPILHPLC